MPKRIKISGERGRWIARAEDRMLAVIHDTWRRGSNDYLDPMVGAKVDGKKYQEFLNALLSEELVILQRDKPGTFERDGYIGIFHFNNLVIGKDGSISLSIVSRYADPKT